MPAARRLRRRLRMASALSVGVILTTGSTFLTSGLAASCAAPRPATAQAALAAIEPAPTRALRYREEIRHPALPAPVTANGILSVAPDGTLVRDQRWPEREISEIGTRVIRVRPAPGAPANTLPIPEAIRPMLAALRAVAERRLGDLAATYPLTLDTAAGGWVVMLTPEGGRHRIALAGCGGRLEGLRLLDPDGAERVITFEAPS